MSSFTLNADPLKHLIITEARLEDAPELAKFSRQLFIDSFAHMNSPDDFYAYVEDAFAPQCIKNELNHPLSRFFIAKCDHIWAGYAKIHKGEPPPCIMDTPALEIARLYVHPDFIGRRIGYSLLNHCRQHAMDMGYRSIWLGSWKKNDRGNRFYERTGFSITGSTTFTLGNDVQEDHVYSMTLR
ncbi:MAG: GNAT family N-acetyltransferase [Desulfobacteraceae bacterium]|nr:MAG: GNAT family N-acetyltransferase [Desulfobacteraceae bacterium]